MWRGTLSTTQIPKAASASLLFTRPTSCQLLLQSTIIYHSLPHRKMSDGMFLSACRQVAKEYPNIAYDEDLLDRVCLQVCRFVAGDASVNML